MMFSFSLDAYPDSFRLVVLQDVKQVRRNAADKVFRFPGES